MSYQLDSPRTTDRFGYSLDPLKETKDLPTGRAAMMADLLNRREQVGRTAAYQRPVHDLDIFAADTTSQLGSLATSLAGMSRGAGSLNGKMADNQGFDANVKNFSENTYRDIGERQKQQRYGDEMLLKNLDVSKLAEDESKEQKRRSGALSERDRALMNQRIRDLPIEGSEAILLPPEMTYGQIEDDQVLSQIFGDLVELKNDKSSLKDQITRSEMAAQKLMDSEKLSVVDRKILQKQLSAAEIDVEVPEDLTYGQVKSQSFLNGFSKNFKGLSPKEGISVYQDRRLTLDEGNSKTLNDIKGRQLTLDEKVAGVNTGVKNRKMTLDEQRAKDLNAKNKGALDFSNKKLGVQERLSKDKLKSTENQNRIKREKEEVKEARPSEKVMERLGVIDTALILIEKIEKEKPKFDTGRGKSAWNTAKGLVGEDDPVFTAFRSDVDRNLANYIKMISGAAAANNERDFLAGIEISTFDDDDTFTLKLQKAKEGIIQTRKILIDGQKFIGKKMPEGLPKPVNGSQFPRKVFKDGKEATIQNEKDLKESQADGWK